MSIYIFNEYFLFSGWKKIMRCFWNFSSVQILVECKLNLFSYYYIILTKIACVQVEERLYIVIDNLKLWNSNKKMLSTNCGQTEKNENY